MNRRLRRAREPAEDVRSLKHVLRKLAGIADGIPCGLHSLQNITAESSNGLARRLRRPATFGCRGSGGQKRADGSKGNDPGQNGSANEAESCHGWGPSSKESPILSTHPGTTQAESLPPSR